MVAEKIVYTNSRGQSITLSVLKPFILESVEGRGGIGTNVQTQTAPYQDGATYIDTTLETRQLTLAVSILANDRNHLNALRSEISSIFNPKLALGKIVYSNGNVSREIDVVVDGPPVFPAGDAKGRRFQRTTINLLAPEPHWKDVNPINEKLEDYTGNFRFPFRAPGIRFAVRGDRRTLINDGDNLAPIFVRFVGNAVNPMIKNETTGDFIKVNHIIPDGFELRISTADGNKYVELVDGTGTRTNVFHYIDLNSTFFKLVQGENVISFITEGGKPDVYVEFKNNYLGV